MTSSSRRQYRHRPVMVDDAVTIEETVNAYSQKHYGDNRLGEDEVRAWFGPDGKPERDDMEIWLDANGEPQAYAQLCDPEWPPTWDVWLDVTVHPASSCDAGLWDDVLDWAERKTRALIAPRNPEAGHRCGARALATDEPGLRAYERRGFVRVRTETLMQIGFDAEAMTTPEWPDGIQVRVLDPDTDLESYALAHGEAFRDHWGHAKLSPEQLIRKKRSEFRGWGDWFMPELWFLAVDGDEIAGGVGSFLNHGGDPARSYLYNVFVRRAWRNRGIATSLLRHSFQAVHERGACSAELHVDSENLTWALQLYRGVGMKPLWHQHLYEKVLPPAGAYRPQ
jgi:mycothiol synthase